MESGLQKAVKRAARTAGIDKHVTCHSLRHSFATIMLENGINSRVLQELMGHADVKTTERYTHVMDKDISRIPSPLEGLDPGKRISRRSHHRSSLPDGSLKGFRCDSPFHKPPRRQACEKRLPTGWTGSDCCRLPERKNSPRQRQPAPFLAGGMASSARSSRLERFSQGIA